MGVEYQGKLIGTGKTFGIIVSRYNSFITKRLLEGAIDGLVRHGVKEEDIGVFWVPGAYEIPTTPLFVLEQLFAAKRHTLILLPVNQRKALRRLVCPPECRSSMALLQQKH